MNDLVYKNELFSSRELMVLAAYSGMEMLRILQAGSQKTLEPEEMNEAVFQLYRKGLLRWNGKNGYEIRPELRRLLQDIKYAEKELEFWAKGQKNPLHCFWGENAVIMELSQNDEDRMKVHSSAKDTFFSELYDREILPEYMTEKQERVDTDDCKNIWIKFQKRNPELIQENRAEQLKKLLGRVPELCAFINVYDRAADQEVSEILLLKNGLCGCIVVLQQGFVHIERLCEENLKMLLEQPVTEKEMENYDLS